MSHRKWNIAIAILFLVFAGLLGSFYLSTLRIRQLIEPILSDDPARADQRHVVLISQELDNPYWRSIEQGATEASAKYGMQLEYEGPIRIDPKEQLKLLEKAISAKADAVLVQGMNDPQSVAVIDQAVSQGIPVITVDTDEPTSRRLAYVGTNNLDAGKMMGELVAKAAGNRGSVAVMLGNELAPNQLLRLEGFRSVIERLPGLSLVDVRSSDISRLQATGETEKLLIRYPNLDFVVGLSALDGIGIADAVERMRPNGPQIFAFDALQETLLQIESGRIHSTIVQQPYDMGYDAITQLNAFFQGKELPDQHFTEIKVLDQPALTNKTGETSS
ncbi:substrate-binding domain-containing protein [Candidatus Pristimantibacillus sp. PTI5]|uniref:substrate-binding domain-containing protein n=1 Tax=Candidatus Pristimantibacillus sp. PTI5 TaxID=3400422 RepID=UPI003B010CC4